MAIDCLELRCLQGNSTGTHEGRAVSYKMTKVMPNLCLLLILLARNTIHISPTNWTQRTLSWTQRIGACFHERTLLVKQRIGTFS
jgi:hypothetical protein